MLRNSPEALKELLVFEILDGIEFGLELAVTFAPSSWSNRELAEEFFCLQTSLSYKISLKETLLPTRKSFCSNGIITRVP